MCRHLSKGYFPKCLFSGMILFPGENPSDFWPGDYGTGCCFMGGRGWGACVLRRQMFPHLSLTFNKTPPLLSRFFFFLNWGIVALQCCVSSAVQQDEQAMRVHVYSPLWTPLLPFGHSPHHPTRVGPHRALS